MSGAYGGEGLDPLQCPFCKCVPGDRCRLEAGEECIFMMDRGYCTNSRCIMAADLEKKSIRRATEKTRRDAVRPIRESWRESMMRRRKEEEKKRKRRMKGRAA